MTTALISARELVAFDEDLHEYTVGGARVPSVTECMSPLINFGFVPQAALEYASDRGTKVHEACALEARDQLDWDSLDAVLVPYVRAFQAFMRDSGFVWEESELVVHHRALAYAGTLDLLGRFGRRLCLPDIKTVASLSPITGIQTAGYAMAWDSENPRNRVRERFALQLRKDGSYRLRQYAEHDDYAVFRALRRLRDHSDDPGPLAALQTWKENHRVH